VFEAVVGAVFLDRGYICAQRFVLNALGLEIADVIAGDRPLKDPKTQLQELVHVLGMTLPVYRVVNVVGPSNERTFTVEVIVEGKVEGISTGRSKLVAEQLSAEQALESLRRL
jgi:ribonuclease-3